MSTKPKFDPNQLTALLNRGTQEARPSAPAPAAAPPPTLHAVPSLPADREPAPAPPPAVTSPPPAAPVTATPDSAAEAIVVKKPITVRLTEDVLHALLRHQADVRCKPGARLGDTTIGGVIDTLLRGPLGLPPV